MFTGSQRVTEMQLFILLMVVPIVEIGLFLTVGSAIGIWPTLGIVVLTALIGSFLLRRQGFFVVHALSSSLGQRKSVGRSAVHALLILAAALLLLTPGFLTDAIGLALLFQPVRDIAITVGGRFLLAQFMNARPKNSRSESESWSRASTVTIDFDN